MIITSASVRKVMDPKQIPTGVYSGSITGFVVTFMVGQDTYECLTMKAISNDKRNCHVVKDKRDILEIVVSN